MGNTDEMSVLLVFFDNLTNTTVDAKVLKAVLVKTK
jgi:hypothetical protein